MPVVNPTIDITKNRLNGYTYDALGNTTKDAQSRKFTYDAENKQTKVETVDAYNNPTSTVGEYFYDGDGKRVKKVAGNETTIFVYNAGGQLVAEYATQTSATPQVSYLTQDHLGSPRINTDQNGQVTARHDYQPFGEEIARAGYGADSVKQKFTSYERDNETGLDFAQTRMYVSSSGRFSTADSTKKIAKRNPQSWNKYTYSFGSPLNYVDLDGEFPTRIHDLITDLSLPNLPREERDTVKRGNFDVDFPKTVFAPFANQHAMRRVGQSTEDARKEAETLVNDNLNKARELKDADRAKSLWYFGQAIHTIQDNISPAHNDFQQYDDSAFLNCIGSIIIPMPGITIGLCANYNIEKRKHDRMESTIFSSDLQRAIRETQKSYEDVYGTAALLNAQGVYSGGTFTFNSVIDGRKEPTGYVTVYYEGVIEYHPKEK